MRRSLPATTPTGWPRRRCRRSRSNAARPIRSGAQGLPRRDAGLRVLLVAESPGRRETMADYFAQYGLQPKPSASFAEFAAADDRLMLGVAPLAEGFSLAAAEAWDRSA